jgi:hypothetical protein
VTSSGSLPASGDVEGFSAVVPDFLGPAFNERNEMKLFNQMRKYGAKVLVGGTAAGALSMAHAAAGDNPIVVLLTSIDLSTVAVAIAAIALIIVGIALTMKGPDVSKRVIRKV